MFFDLNENEPCYSMEKLPYCLFPAQRCHKKTHEAEPEKQFHRTFLIPPQLKTSSDITLHYTNPSLGAAAKCD